MLDKLYKKTFAPYAILFLVCVLSTFALWLPFLLKVDSINGIQTKGVTFETVLKNWDGPLYIISAKTLYNPNNAILMKSPLGLDSKYFAAHLPLYPLTLRTLAPLMGYMRATVFSTLLTSILLVWFFFYFISSLKLSKNPLLLSIVFLFIMPRFFIVRSVGSPEPLFILLILVSLFFFIKEKYVLAGLFGGLSAMTKTPGILLFVAYGLFFAHLFIRVKKFEWKWLWILLIPFGLFLVFLFYGHTYGDFFAYFHSGDNIHLVFPPFSVFNFQKKWVDTAWLEEIIFLYFFYFLTIFGLFERMRKGENKTYAALFYFGIIFLVSIISVQHRDISRYSLPLLPLGLIAFEEFFTSKKFAIALLLFLPAIYFYAVNFILSNPAPIADWTPFL